MLCKDKGKDFCDREEIAQKVVASPSLSTKIASTPSEKSKEQQNLDVIDLQKDAVKKSLKLKGADGLPYRIDLINLNPAVNSWYLLKLVWSTEKSEWFHLENGQPKTVTLELNESFNKGLQLSSKKGIESCELWTKKNFLRSARAANAPYASLCNGQVFLRNRIEGYKTTKEWVVEFLRANIVGGETITSIVKETVYKDNFLISTGETINKGNATTALPDGPEPALLNEKFKGELIDYQEIGIPIQNADPRGLEAGKWFRSESQPGVFLSALEPRAIDAAILKSHSDYAKSLDPVEMQAVSYLVAFDLGFFDLSFAIGTDHPSVNWSERTLPEVRDPSLKGPDGFSTIAPLTGTGLIPPYVADRVAGIFTGGFKRDHGSFHWGELARKNRGSHYGFVENGIVLSTLQPNLATLIVYNDGTVDFKTWQESDVQNLNKIRYARQNGVAVIEWDAVQNKGVPGRYVSNWTLGNWSGSQDKKFRTLRAGVCLQEKGARRFLIYGYFSSMTPTAMARVFQAYNCRYAMHLDMNALEHTYMALYSQTGGKERKPQHLVRGMKVLDERFKGNVPRYIGYPDNRDFFYFTLKPAEKGP